MNVLIVVAHPERQSLNHAMGEVMRERFASRGWTVTVVDLYAQRFHATPSPADFRSLHNPDRFSLAHEQRHAAKRNAYRVDILQQQEKVQRADFIIFQFPLWWYAVPAILKGWVERILGNGFAYDDSHMFENGLLKGKRAMLSLTTGGTRAELDEDSVYTGTVEEFLRAFSGGVLAFCGIQPDPPFIAYAVSKMNDEERRQMFDSLRARIDGVVASFPATAASPGFAA